MFIEEVEIHKILGCEKVDLCFGDTRRSHVYVVQKENNLGARGILSLAVQLVCSAKFANISSLTDPIFKDIYMGGVRIKFILPLTPGRDSYDAIGIQLHSETNEYGVGACGDETDDDDLTLINIDAVDDEHDVADDLASELIHRPCTSREARERENFSQRSKRSRRRAVYDGGDVKKFLLVNAYRDFRKSPEEVFYTINDGPEECSSLPAFHGRFYICLDYMLPQLENLHIDFNGDWLELLASDLNNKWNQREQFYDPFERFVHLFLKYGYPEQHILSQITRAHLLSKDTMDVLQKTYAVKILRDTRGIFEFITAGEFTVWFYVPHYGRYADAVVDVMVENLDFDLMNTYIQDKSKPVKKAVLWVDAHVAIKDLLLISFQISLGFHCKQQILYLDNFDEIHKYQTIQLASATYLKKLDIPKMDWTSKNYLQRIIDVCITSGTTAIIEYPGGIPLHPVNAYLIKSYKIPYEDKSVSDLQIINGEKYSFDYFLQCLQDGLRN